MKNPYSPFNKTYKYLSLQNQLAHVKNLHNTSGLVNTNLSIVSNSSYNNHSHSKSRYSHKKLLSFSNTLDCSAYANLKQSPRIIHMNQSFNKIQQNKIFKENQRLAQKLLQTTCKVLTVKQTGKDYAKHQIYEQLGRKYSNNSSNRKDLVSFIGCPLEASRLKTQRYNGQFCTVDKQRLLKINRPSTGKSYRRLY